MAYLEGKDVELQKHDLAKDPPSRELLEELIDEDNLDQVLNRRSPSYKERGLGEKKLTKRETIDLMMEDPNLIRRPLVVCGKRAVFGFAPGELDIVSDPR